MKIKTIVCFALTALFVFCASGMLSAQIKTSNEDFESVVDEAVIAATNGDAAAKQYLFYSAVLGQKEAKYLLKVSEENKNHAYFQYLAAICLFTLGDKEKALLQAKEAGSNPQFTGMDKYSLATYLTIEGGQTKDERYFAAAREMFESLHEAGFKDMGDLNEKVFICIPGSLARKKFMEGM